MHEDAGNEMKLRLRTDLRGALKGGRGSEVRLIRALLAAIDNAEAVPLPAEPAIHGRSTEVERLFLSGARVRAVLLAEIREREEAAEIFERHGETERAAPLRAEAFVARRYID